MRTYLYLTYRCNCNCFFCASDETNIITHDNEICFEDVKRFLIKSPDKQHLIISGGEPTIHKDFLKIVEFAKRYYENITLLTNGIKFSDIEFLQRTIDMGVNRISIPFYTPIKEEHNQMVGNPASLDNVMACLSNLNALITNNSIDVRIKLLLARFTYRTIPDSIEYIVSNFPNIRRLSLNGLHIGEKALKHSSDSVMNYSEARLYNDLIIEKLLYYKFDFQLCDVPLCAFSRAIVKKLLTLKKIAYVDEAFLKRPDAKSKVVSTSAYGPKECNSCSLSNMCPKIYGKNASIFNYGLNPF